MALTPFAERFGDGGESGGGGEDQIAYAGLYIGWLERFLMLTALLVGSYTSVGLIIAAKSIFRLPDAKQRPLAEYFLIGTLLSVAVTVAGALLLRSIIGL